MTSASDLDHCRTSIRHGSLSFYAASKLLPARMRDPALALYAFCRLADDAVDLNEEKTAAVFRLRERLDAIYAGAPHDAPEDRAFADVVRVHRIPKTVPDALLEGFAWDALEQTYSTLSEVRAYGARVASTVGIMMALIMGVRDEHALARAADLGVAMQLTNIARDVGEDAREGRLYLPTDWLSDAGLSEGDIFANPIPSEPIRTMTKRLLREADRLYLRAEAGIPALPRQARPGIFAARHVYAGIGGVIAKNGYDSITTRARTNTSAKIGWLGLSVLRSWSSMVMPRSAVIYAPPLDETDFLIQAAAETTPRSARDARRRALLDVFAELEARDRASMI
ncbi:MAG: phytoene/squalene synthase family protein [Pseudomonadota bacterium]